MAREIVAPVRDGDGEDHHPAFALIGANRVSASGGHVLFDSDVTHHRFVTVRLNLAARSRQLNHDYLFPKERIVEVAMSEAQWASFVSSMGVGNGVPCTIQFREGEGVIPGLPYEPRLQESMDEVRSSAAKSMEKIRAAYAVAAEKPTKANMRELGFAIEHGPANMEFAAKSLNEHAENVVQKARADIEAMVLRQAEALGIEPGDLGFGSLQLEAGAE